MHTGFYENEENTVYTWISKFTLLFLEAASIPLGAVFKFSQSCIKAHEVVFSFFYAKKHYKEHPLYTHASVSTG